ncbi:MAG: hypothetical protein Terrestrivirus2_173 [Terrestrivirus sp.]|uniref:Uncharacterized protein n=1 Tax=Terrestrivirus sp. TaxID=2487775 RepID=A0A3G4ZLE8_9VIRU|nr:MAG: hypothetical protein Terrestrivirus2_173 [Terrestrivirus sp.]
MENIPNDKMLDNMDIDKSDNKPEQIGNKSDNKPKRVKKISKKQEEEKFERINIIKEITTTINHITELHVYENENKTTKADPIHKTTRMETVKYIDVNKIKKSKDHRSTKN